MAHDDEAPRPAGAHFAQRPTIDSRASQRPDETSQFIVAAQAGASSMRGSRPVSPDETAVFLRAAASRDAAPAPRFEPASCGCI